MGTGAAGVGSGSRIMRSFSSFPGLKYGTFFGGTSTLSPVFGLRPLRGSRRRRRKLPNPRSSIFSPRCSASMMLLNTVSTMISECFLVRSDTRETSSTSSAFVMLPLVIGLSTCYVRRPHVPRANVGTCYVLRAHVERAHVARSTLLLVLEVIAQRHFRSSRRLRVGFPVRPEL